MKPKIISIAVAAVLALGATAPGLAAPSHDNGSQQATSLKLSLGQHGRKWETDEALRQGMAGVRSALALNLAGVRSRSLTAAEYQALVQALETQVAFIVANCKLPPEADANLHVIVEELMAAAEAMKAPSQARAAEGAQHAVRAANAYGKYFFDPQWRAL